MNIEIKEGSLYYKFLMNFTSIRNYELREGYVDSCTLVTSTMLGMFLVLFIAIVVCSLISLEATGIYEMFIYTAHGWFMHKYNQAWVFLNSLIGVVFLMYLIIEHHILDKIHTPKMPAIIKDEFVPVKKLYVSWKEKYCTKVVLE